jgi:hypothetical protein
MLNLFIDFTPINQSPNAGWRRGNLAMMHKRSGGCRRCPQASNPVDPIPVITQRE